MKQELVKKGNSRCFVFEKEHIEIVKDTIKEIDEFEFDYMPDDWVEFWDYPNAKYCPQMVYNGKFDIDVINLKIACAKKSVAISIVSTNIDDDSCY
jgi:hypothetical protein